MVKSTTSKPLTSSPQHLLSSPGGTRMQTSSQPTSPLHKQGSQRMPESELPQMARQGSTASTSTSRPPRNSAPSSHPGEISLRFGMAEVNTSGRRGSSADSSARFSISLDHPPAAEPHVNTSGHRSSSAGSSSRFSISLDHPPAAGTQVDLEAGHGVPAQAEETPAPGAGARLWRKGKQLASGAKDFAQGSMTQIKDTATAGATYAKDKAVAGGQYASEKIAQGYHYTADKATHGWNATSAFTRRTAQDLIGDRLPSRAAAGAFAGHTLQQLLTCGIPTFSREYAMLQIYRGIVNSKFAQDNPFAIVGMQAVISTMAVVAHAKLRHARMDRDQAAAVKGHFGLTNDQWRDMPNNDRLKLLAVQQADSRRVTANQVMAEVGNLTMSTIAAAEGDPTVAARVLATQIRNVIYAGMRELMQASIKFVNVEGPGTSGVNNANMSSMAAVYTLMTMGASTASDGVVSAVLNARSVGLNGLQFQTVDSNNPVNDPQLHNAALVALIRGLFNTSVEVIDAGLGKHYETKQVGAQQVWNSGNKLPMTDHDRVFDHSVARFSWNQFAGMANLAVQQIATASGLRDKAPNLTSFLGVATTAAAFGLAYRNTNQTYQAHARVRSAVANPPAIAPPPGDGQQPVQTAQPHTTQVTRRGGVTIKEITEDVEAPVQLQEESRRNV
ncbi:hypothetical protein [Paracidovorax anthurii]|uniref:Uncharacterized protein n=1 Tax=Paracidovorax anthurii TaxID=78229 RepID=A0A328YW04_9BURK|nr:hypothetical protein [Paracidovorax anthurii]RAR77990.1 hypothetical protein AX018_103328 [Paracidovorax anthurii]